jgi:hypothetical protein
MKKIFLTLLLAGSLSMAHAGNLSDASGTIATGAASQLLLAANPGPPRTFFFFQNQSAHVMWLQFGTTGAGTTVTISNASPAVVGWTSHGFSAGQPVQFGGGGATLTAPIVAGQTYYVISAGLVTNAFEISATVGGAAINTTTASAGTLTGWGLASTTSQPSIQVAISGGILRLDQNFISDDAITVISSTTSDAFTCKYR